MSELRGRWELPTRFHLVHTRARFRGWNPFSCGPPRVRRPCLRPVRWIYPLDLSVGSGRQPRHRRQPAGRHFAHSISIGDGLDWDCPLLSLSSHRPSPPRGRAVPASAPLLSGSGRAGAGPRATAESLKLKNGIVTPPPPAPAGSTAACELLSPRAARRAAGQPPPAAFLP